MSDHPTFHAAVARCAPMGRLEYVVESHHHGDVETWLVIRPDPAVARHFEVNGVTISSHCRVVVEAESLRPVGVIPEDVPVAPSPAGYNPYFDVPPA